MKWSAELELKPTEDFVTVKSDQPIVPQMGGGRRSGQGWGWVVVGGRTLSLCGQVQLL